MSQSASSPTHPFPQPAGSTAEDEASLRPLLVSIEGAAEILAISRTSIYQLIWNDELEPIRIGRCLRFSVEQLERFVAQRTRHRR